MIKEVNVSYLMNGWNCAASVSLSTFMCLWAIYVLVCLYSAAEKYLSWEYINRSQTHECGNWDRGHAIPYLGTHKWDFRCSVLTRCGFWHNPNLTKCPIEKLSCFNKLLPGTNQLVVFLKTQPHFNYVLLNQVVCKNYYIFLIPQTQD